MNDITIIVPLHIYNENVQALLDNAINSVNECAKLYDDKLKVMFVLAKSIEADFMPWLKDSSKYSSIDIFDAEVNEGKTDFCSQINFGVDKVDTDYFSILEFDDSYTPKWFCNAKKYYLGNESVSVFLPINLFHDGNFERWQYGNTMAISPMFITSDENDNDELGIINYMRLEKCALFNITGGIFNTKDFISVGKYKPSIKAAFNYELLLRMTKLGLKAMVVPKEGYVHALGREGSLTEIYTNELSEEDQNKWFNLALRECVYKEDREKDIENLKEETVK